MLTQWPYRECPNAIRFVEIYDRKREVERKVAAV
jgi:hypothetical protein